MTRAIIYDIETLSQDQHRGVILSLALLNFDLNRVKYGTKYTYQELLDSVHFIKFDVQSQVKNYGRKICPNTLQWWSEQSKEAQKQLQPTAYDEDIQVIHNFFTTNTNHPEVAFTRNNTFDPVFIQFLCQQFDKPMPHNWWVTRDTKSLIDGMTWGQDIDDRFIPEGLEHEFIAHDPRHDVVMDVMRIQYISGLLIDEIPF